VILLCEIAEYVFYVIHELWLSLTLSSWVKYGLKEIMLLRSILNAFYIKYPSDLSLWSDKMKEIEMYEA
jgi:hypothetical protein